LCIFIVAFIIMPSYAFQNVYVIKSDKQMKQYIFDASIQGQPVPGGYKYRDLALQVGGVSRIGMIKYGLEFRRTVLARTSSNSK
jgi:hypothetical protein